MHKKQNLKDFGNRAVVDPDLQIREGPRHLDPEIREGPVSKRVFAAPGASVWSNNKGRARAPQAPPLDSLLQGAYYYNHWLI